MGLYTGGKPKPPLFTVCSLTQGVLSLVSVFLGGLRSNDTIAIYKALRGLLDALVSLPWFVPVLFCSPSRSA